MWSLKCKSNEGLGGGEISRYNLGDFENNMYSYHRDFNPWSWGGVYSTTSTHSSPEKKQPLLLKRIYFPTSILGQKIKNKKKIVFSSLSIEGVYK